MKMTRMNKLSMLPPHTVPATIRQGFFMENIQPPSDGICPCCQHMAEQLTSRGPWIFNRVFNSYLCEGCNIELSIEFYEEDSEYFEMASKMSGMDVWEIRKRYLEDVMESTLKEMSGDTSEETIQFLTEKIQNCRIQIGAIENYLQVKKESEDQDLIMQEYENLKKSLVAKVVDVDYAIPTVIGIEIP